MSVTPAHEILPQEPGHIRDNFKHSRWKKRSILGITFKGGGTTYEHGKYRTSHDRHDRSLRSRSSEGGGGRPSRTSGDIALDHLKADLLLPDRSSSRHPPGTAKLGGSDDEAIHSQQSISRSTAHLKSVPKWSRPSVMPDKNSFSKARSTLKMVRPATAPSSETKSSCSTLRSSHREQLSYLPVEQPEQSTQADMTEFPSKTSGAPDSSPRGSPSEHTKGPSKHFIQEYSGISNPSPWLEEGQERKRTRNESSWSQSVLAETTALIDSQQNVYEQGPASQTYHRVRCASGPNVGTDSAVQAASRHADSLSVARKDSATQDRRETPWVLTKYEKVLGLVPGPPPSDGNHVPRPPRARGALPVVSIPNRAQEVCGVNSIAALPIVNTQRPISHIVKAPNDTRNATTSDKNKLSINRDFIAEATLRPIFERRQSLRPTIQLPQQPGLFVSDLNSPTSLMTCSSSDIGLPSVTQGVITPAGTSMQSVDSSRVSLGFRQPSRFADRGVDTNSSSSKADTPPRENTSRGPF
ncbi:unnamed protein product [Sympodiomycopsis kandeliae]